MHHALKPRTCRSEYCRLRLIPRGEIAAPNTGRHPEAAFFLGLSSIAFAKCPFVFPPAAVLPAATNVFIMQEEISFRYPKSCIDLLASGKQVDPATLEPSLKEKTGVLNNHCLGLDYCVSSLRPFSPSEEEKKTPPSTGSFSSSWFDMWSSWCVLKPSWKSLFLNTSDQSNPWKMCFVWLSADTFSGKMVIFRSQIPTLGLVYQ